MSGILFNKIMLKPSSGNPDDGNLVHKIDADWKTAWSFSDDTVLSLAANAFYNYQYIDSVSFKNATSIGYGAFYYSSIKTIDMPNVTSIDGEAFEYSKIQAVSFPKLKSVTGNYIFNRSSIVTADFPILESCNGLEFLMGCSSLTSITAPLLTTTGSFFMDECTSIKSIDFPNLISASEFSFHNCAILESVNLPKLNVVYQNLFQSDYALKSISLPSVFIKIGSYAFNSCQTLSQIVVGTQSSTAVCPLESTTAFTETPIATSTTDGYIYVADSLVDQYKTATNWVTYASKIKGISELPS